MLRRALLGLSLVGGMVLLAGVAVLPWWQGGAASDGGNLTDQRSELPLQSPMEDRSVRNIVFLHHSVGANLLAQGNLRGLLTERGFDLYDQDYNEYGLTLPNGEPAGFGYRVPDDNTDPDGLAAIFTAGVDPMSVAGTGPPANTVSGLLRHDVIMFKSCFPVNGITSDAQLEAYKGYYRSIRAFAHAHPDRLFIALSPPPLEPKGTNRAEAARARAFATWLASPEFAGSLPNVAVIDLFDLFAESDPNRSDFNMLRVADQPGADSSHPKAVLKRMINVGLERTGSERRLGGGDSHPNARANQRVAPQVADAVERAIQTYRATARRPVGSTS